VTLLITLIGNSMNLNGVCSFSFGGAIEISIK
jgi:hypothetical protein